MYGERVLVLIDEYRAYSNCNIPWLNWKHLLLSNFSMDMPSTIVYFFNPCSCLGTKEIFEQYMLLFVMETINLNNKKKIDIY